MRLVRWLSLYAITVGVLMALASPPAFASEQVEVVNEDTGVHCGAVDLDPQTPPPCDAHAFGSVTFAVDLGIFGEASEATCFMELDIRMFENGGGLIDWMELSPGDGNCPTVVTGCNLPWPVSGEEEETTTGWVESNASICIDPAEGPVCQGTLSFDQLEDGAFIEDHRWFISSSVGLCEIHGNLWFEHLVTDYDEIHVNHP